MKNTIEQILQIKGVKRIETKDDNSLLVVLKKSSEQKLIKKAIQKGFLDGVKFKWDDALPYRIHSLTYPLHADEDSCLHDSQGVYICIDGDWATIVNYVPEVVLVSDDGVNLYEGDMFYMVPFVNPVHTGHELLEVYPDIVVPLRETERWNKNYKRFSTWQAAKNWIADNTPTLKIEQLVNGDIYTDIEDGRIIRFKNIAGTYTLGLYSQLLKRGVFFTGTGSYCYDVLRRATKEEKQSLIRAEVANGYFHGIR